MFSRSGQYALRAMVYLTQHGQDGPVTAARIAREVDIPRQYLSTLLSTLVRAGLLVSAPGARGGFRLARPPRRIRLVEIVEPFEALSRRDDICPFGNIQCGDDNPCAGHTRWKKVKEAYFRFLRETSIHEVAFPSDKPSPRKAPRRKNAKRRKKRMLR